MSVCAGDFSALVCVVCVCVCVHACVHVCVCVCHVCLVTVVCVCVCVCGWVCAGIEVTEVYDTMSCLPIVSDRAVTEGSKYFELGWQPHNFFNSKYLLFLLLIMSTWTNKNFEQASMCSHLAKCFKKEVLTTAPSAM